MTFAFVFPGQGSQSIGMGKGVFDASANARRDSPKSSASTRRSLSRNPAASNAEVLPLGCFAWIVRPFFRRFCDGISVFGSMGYRKRTARSSYPQVLALPTVNTFPNA